MTCLEENLWACTFSELESTFLGFVPFVKLMFKELRLLTCVSHDLQQSCTEVDE